jgi:hypothetical protein
VFGGKRESRERLKWPRSREEEIWFLVEPDSRSRELEKNITCMKKALRMGADM